MKPSHRSLALALGLAIATVGCSDQQSADRATPAVAEPTVAAPATEPAADVSELTVELWGPQATPVGTAFNAQADGQSALFIKLSGEVPSTGVEVSFDGKPLINIVANGDLVTGTVPTEYLQEPGTFAIEMTVPAQDARIPVGSFIVDDETASEADGDGDAGAVTSPPTT